MTNNMSGVYWYNTTEANAPYQTAPDSLQIINDTSFNIGAQPFTIEWYQFADIDSNSQARVFSIGTYPSAKLAVSYDREASQLLLWINHVSINLGILPPSEEWVHIAIVGSTDTIRVFQNGVLRNTVATNYNILNDTSQTIAIGNETAASFASSWHGGLTNVRIIVGVALYSTSFAVPIATLTSVSNTVLLLQGTPGFNDASPYTRSVTNVGVVWRNDTPFQIGSLQSPSITFGLSSVTFNWLPPIDYNYNSTISKYKITTTSDVLVAFVQVPRFRDVEGESYTLYETNGGNYRLSAINSLDVEGPSVTLPEPVTVTTTDATTSAISALVTNIVYTSTDNVSFIKKETTAETLEADLGASINTLYANNVKKQFIEYTVNDVQTTISATAIKVSDAALSVDTTNDTTIAFNVSSGSSGLNTTDVILAGTSLDPVVSDTPNFGSFFLKVFDAAGQVRTDGFSIPITIYLDYTTYLSLRFTDFRVQRQTGTGRYANIYVNGNLAMARRDRDRDSPGQYAYTYMATSNSSYIFVEPEMEGTFDHNATSATDRDVQLVPSTAFSINLSRYQSQCLSLQQKVIALSIRDQVASSIVDTGRGYVQSFAFPFTASSVSGPIVNMFGMIGNAVGLHSNQGLRLIAYGNSRSTINGAPSTIRLAEIANTGTGAMRAVGSITNLCSWAHSPFGHGLFPNEYSNLSLEIFSGSAVDTDALFTAYARVVLLYLR